LVPVQRFFPPNEELLIVAREAAKKWNREHGGDPEEACDCGRRRLRKDLSAHRLQQGPVPRSVRAHRLRKLRRRH